MIVFIMGGAGVGKSTLGKELAKSISYTYLDKDTISKRFVDVFSENRDSDIYTKVLRDIEYKTLVDMINEQISVGNTNLVVVAPFLKEMKDTDWIKNNLIGCENSLSIILKSCDIEMKANMILRNSNMDKEKLNDWTNYINNLDISCNWINSITLDYSVTNMRPCINKIKKMIN